MTQTWYYKKHGFRHDVYVNPIAISIKWRFGGKCILWKNVVSIDTCWDTTDVIVIESVDAKIELPMLSGLEEYIRETHARVQGPISK